MTYLFNGKYSTKQNPLNNNYFYNNNNNHNYKNHNHKNKKTRKKIWEKSDILFFVGVTTVAALVPSTHASQSHSTSQSSPPYPPQPPPPPSIPGTAYTPIHYSFPSKVKQSIELSNLISTTNSTTNNNSNHNTKAKANANTNQKEYEYHGPIQMDDDEFPLTLNHNLYQDQHQYPISTMDATDVASPRRDAVTTYMATTRGALTIRTSCIMVGYTLGFMIGKSLLSNTAAHGMGCIMAVTFFLFSWGRSCYGELVRALGLALLRSIKQTSTIRHSYPTKPHILASMGLRPRTLFPPDTTNPWAYTPKFSNDPDFSMPYTLIAMTLLGSTVGGAVPILPTWLGATIGAAGSAWGTTWQSPPGDVMRCMGARLVALGTVVVETNAQLKLLSKTMVVAGNILDKVLILDRKHKIKEKIVTASTVIYEQVMKTVQQIQSGIKDESSVKRSPRQDNGRTAENMSRRKGESNMSRQQRPRDEFPPGSIAPNRREDFPRDSHD